MKASPERGADVESLLERAFSVADEVRSELSRIRIRIALGVGLAIGCAVIGIVWAPKMYFDRVWNVSWGDDAALIVLLASGVLALKSAWTAIEDMRAELENGWRVQQLLYSLLNEANKQLNPVDATIIEIRMQRYRFEQKPLLLKVFQFLMRKLN